MAIELWSWLKKDTKRQRFFSEDGFSISSDEFMQKVADKMRANEVPATLTNETINWDRSIESSNASVLNINTDGTVNPFSCLIQFNVVGKYAFVEEKVFITPPNIKDLPREPKIIDADLYSKRNLIICAIIAIVGGLIFWDRSSEIGLTLLVIGLCFGGSSISAHNEIKKIKKHNTWCQRVLDNWNKEWNKWEETIYIHSFQEGTNGNISRIYDAVYDCIKQVCTELFEGKPFHEDDESSSMSELEQLIAKRKEEYK